VISSRRLSGGTFVGPAIAGAVGTDERAEAFWNAGDGQLCGEGAAARPVQVPQDRQASSNAGDPVGLQVDREVVEQTGRKLAQIAIAFHHQWEHVTGVARQPLLRLLELDVQALREESGERSSCAPRPGYLLIKGASGPSCGNSATCPGAWCGGV